MFRVYANGETVIPNNAYFGGTTTIFASGTATFGGRVTTTDHIRSNRTGSTDPVFIGRLNSTETIRLVADGSAQFATSVQVVGNGAAGTEVGLVLGAGSINATRAPGSNSNVFRGYSTGNSTPTSRISSDGSAEFAGDLTLGSGTTTDERYLKISTKDQPISLELRVNDSTDFLIENDAGGNLKVKTPNADLVTINSNGLLVGGTLPSSPNITLKANGSAEFDGDITCTDNSKGLVLTSPNGTSFRLSVANDGTLSASSI